MAHETRFLHLVDKQLSCKWLFTINFNADGTLDQYKARLVAKSITQTYGNDYQETFSPMAKLNTVCVLNSIATNKDRPLYQLAVIHTFLNGDLEVRANIALDVSVVSKYMHSQGKPIHALSTRSSSWGCLSYPAVLKGYSRIRNMFQEK